MSGGVDSSVAAALLKDDGYEVVGCFMRLGSPGESLNDPAAQSCDTSKMKIGHQGCCSINDAKDAELVAAKLDIPFYVLNFKKDFGRIIDYFVGEYNAGRTPNPCVRCNDWLKFGKLADYARSIDAEWVATGHYARTDTVDGTRALLRGVDHTKDQSYVLFGSPLDELTHMMLPVGRYTKDEIRKIAQEMSLPVFNKPDSQEICFVPDMDYAGLIKRTTPGDVHAGKVVDVDGNEVGEHEGHQHFTIGQRRGVGVALGYPIYVVDKDAETNTVTVGPRERLAASACEADQTNWLIDPPVDAPLRCTAKIRYNAEPVPAHVRATGEGALRVTFDEPQFAVAPGQAVVCYDGERVLGGGWITRAEQL
ncbi:MAG: tRNA 2-thiouridine(34) synthase MnmA [Phycisphaera sp.]|nr:tRNA 2-thiouridine(34) synthase MnmA [Phycisphaera sp.]